MAGRLEKSSSGVTCENRKRLRRAPLASGVHCYFLIFLFPSCAWKNLLLCCTFHSRVVFGVTQSGCCATGCMTVVCKTVANKSSDYRAVENRPVLRVRVCAYACVCVCVMGLCLSCTDIRWIKARISPTLATRRRLLQTD